MKNEELELASAEKHNLEYDIDSNNLPTLTKSGIPCRVTLNQSIQACIGNGQRLLEEAEWHSYSLSPTALVLLILAQEEFAKAFILQLVMEKALPWSASVQKSIKNHECKHLMTIVMNWLASQLEDQFDLGLAWAKGEQPKNVTKDVACAINIYRHEMIEKLSGEYFTREPEWNGLARNVARGCLDRRKQRALYVAIAPNGSIKSTPSVAQDEINNEMNRARKFEEVVVAANGDRILAQGEYRHLKDFFRTVFEVYEKKYYE